MMKKILAIGAVIALACAAYIYFSFFTNNTAFEDEEVYVYIPSNSNYEQARKIITPFVKDFNSFDKVAKLRKYDTNVKSGRFLLKKGMGSFSLVGAMRKNLPVKIAFNNQERLENFVQRISSQIEPDSTKLINAITDSVFLKENGFTKENVLGMFMPNTYEFYWNTSAEKFRDKMIKEYKKFWTEERLSKAKKLNLSPAQVIILASIVHKETVKSDERPKVAKVYLNRMEIGMPLQADPTVIYAKKLADNNFDQVIKRVAGAMLSLNSPYNTYINQGLPPGPIAMPDISAIDAVLNPENHNYIYFCASTERFGYHDFAETFAQHQVNATRYAKWLNEQGIKR